MYKDSYNKDALIIEKYRNSLKHANAVMINLKTLLTWKCTLKSIHTTKASYACKYWDFVAEQPKEVRLGKFHSYDLETLETHLYTCELFICYDCEKRFNNLGDIKKHIDKTLKKAVFSTSKWTETTQTIKVMFCIHSSSEV